MKKIKFWLAIFLVLVGSFLTMEGIKYLGLRSYPSASFYEESSLS